MYFCFCGYGANVSFLWRPWEVLPGLKDKVHNAGALWGRSGQEISVTWPLGWDNGMERGWHVGLRLKWKTEPRTTVHAHKCWSKNLFHTNDALVLRWPRILLYVYPRVQQSCFIMLCKQSWGGGETAQSRIPVTAIGRSYTLFPVSLWKTCFAWETAFRRVLELLQFTAAGRASVG